ncbi:MAG: transporter substrate-binding domain-containing protein [Pseudomonadota bacterium]
MTRLARSLAAAIIAVAAAPAAAECVTARHVVAPGETAFSIAEEYYGAHETWSLIFYANVEALSDPMELAAGTELTIPCPPGGQAFTTATTPLRPDEADMRLLTGGALPPFTDRDWPVGGMVTELVAAALEEMPAPVTVSLDWDDDRSGHLEALAVNDFDMGFPWLKPGCAGPADHVQCGNFHFSDPIVEVVSLLFVRDGAELVFEADTDLHGKTLCRPAGVATYDLDGEGRRWLSAGHVALAQPATAGDCFDLLVSGEVDAVALNEFTGWTTLAERGLMGEVAPLERPLGVEGLHVIISKRHWRGTTHLYRINEGLARLKESARYDEIVSRHLGVFWDRVN